MPLDKAFIDEIKAEACKDLLAEIKALEEELAPVREKRRQKKQAKEAEKFKAASEKQLKDYLRKNPL